LSIGYSACHWCHVMAHESFEHDETAELMNRLFVNIKVDREERPDIDRIYQVAHQLLTQRGGGWPLTMFINPEDQRPFFGGTYFPREARYGMPAFGDLLQRVAGYYHDSRDDVRGQGEQLSKIFDRLKPQPAEDRVLGEQPLKAVREALSRSFDREFGGFGAAPKFPHPTSIDRVLRHWRNSANGEEPDVEALFMATLTLTRMAEGGIYDQLGGGFCRYSVDRYWQIPHFEKMLYDNGPLLALYAQAAIATGEPLFGRIANETAGWMLGDMQAPNGGFYSTRDADSEGEEGKFYVWSREELQSLLADDEYALVAAHYGVDSEANFEGHWHLTVHESLQAIAEKSSSTVSQLTERLDRARKKLLEVRANRIWPGRDEKQLTSWNALAIRGLAIAGRALDRPDLNLAASRAVDFLRENLVQDGRLYASYKDDRTRFPAYLDDHAFLLDALLELLQSQWQMQHLAFAIEIADLLLAHFHDNDEGGFFFTADDHEVLIDRPKPLADEALPSGNGTAAFALQRLGFLLGDSRYLDAAEKTLRAASQAMAEYPHGHVSLITALEEYLVHPEIIVIRGDAGDIGRWRDSAARLYAPRRLVFAIERDAKELPGALAERRPVDGETVAYRCVGNHCSLPISGFEALAAELRES
ncbi:MAG: thioredoxin domain-containing protein, partial [Woeseiaceae bacterium]